MIFCSRNERGLPAWLLITQGRKTVTRRLKPVDVGKVVAVCPGRGKRAVAHVKVKSCVRSMIHYHDAADATQGLSLTDWKAKEAKLEGFETWGGLMRWFEQHKIQYAETYRIEFERVGEDA